MTLRKKPFENIVEQAVFVKHLWPPKRLFFEKFDF